MANYQIKVSTQDIRAAANYIQQKNKELTDLLSESIKIVTGVAGVTWVSEAASETLKKIRTYEKPMEQFQTEVSKYVDFLNNAAENIESSESANVQNTAEKEFRE